MLDSRRADVRTTESSWNQASNRWYRANFGSANGAGGITAAAGLPSDERFYSAQHVSIRRPNTVHAKEGWRIHNVYRLPRAQADHHQVALPDPTSRRTSRPTLRRQVFLENRLTRRLPPDSCCSRGLSQDGVSHPLRTYEYLVMPFGLTNAPSTFQITTNGIFRELLDKCVIIYLDNILIYSRSREQHLQDLDACDFLKQELEFLGHVVSTEGVKIDPKKIKTIHEWKPPSNIKELQSFFGFVNYVSRFIPNMAGLSAPLTDRLKDHDCFWWGEKQQAAFDQLKIALTSPPVLRISDPDRPYEVITDASDIAIGAILLQDFGDGLQPVAYESRKLQGAEKNYTVHNKEMLAIVHAFKTWRCYLTGADVTVQTDHKSLQPNPTEPNRTQPNPIEPQPAS
ncbi:hypothetical protein CLOM_g2418 [Closterium sp. NIES-68]|nr:hypothetical protein CLOM_g2418 [Closterium sp. NIES-68]